MTMQKRPGFQETRQNVAQIQDCNKTTNSDSGEYGMSATSKTDVGNEIQEKKICKIFWKSSLHSRVQNNVLYQLKVVGIAVFSLLAQSSL